MLSIIMLLFFLTSVSGVNVNIHYCDSELVGMTVNGIHFKTEAGQKMADCCSENSGCPMCKHVASHYQLHQQFMQSSTPQVHPLLLANDWFHGVPINFDYLLFDFIPAEEGSNSNAYAYVNSYLGSNSNAYAYVNSYLGFLYLTYSGLRAPPTMKQISFQHLFMV